MSTELLKYLADKIQNEISVIERDLSLGGAKDHGDYKYACGIVRGLRMTTNIIIETAERMESDNG